MTPTRGPWYRVFDHLPALPDWYLPVFILLGVFG
jgi:hypothetical protein